MPDLLGWKRHGSTETCSAIRTHIGGLWGACVCCTDRPPLHPTGIGGEGGNDNDTTTIIVIMIIITVGIIVLYRISGIYRKRRAIVVLYTQRGRDARIIAPTIILRVGHRPIAAKRIRNVIVAVTVLLLLYCDTDTTYYYYYCHYNNIK